MSNFNDLESVIIDMTTVMVNNFFEGTDIEADPEIIKSEVKNVLASLDNLNIQWQQSSCQVQDDKTVVNETRQ